MNHRLETSGVTLNCHEWPAEPSDPPPVVLLHGFTGSAETVSGLATAFPSRRVLAPEIVGHGLSDSPSDVAEYSMGACIAQVANALEQLGVIRCDLVGYSMGARVALSLAAARPQLVRNLALIGGSAGISDPATRARRRQSDSELAARIENEGIEWFVDYWMAQPLFASQARLEQSIRAAARQQRLRNDPTGLANSLRGMGSGSMPDLTGVLGDLTVPTWWIHGRDDVKFADLARAGAATMPNAQVRSIASAGHAAHLENPAAVADVLTVAFNPPRFPV